MATPQSQAINGANDLLFVMQQFQQVRATIDNWLRQWSANGYGTIWNAWPTAPVSADGSLGTADGSPNTTHPVDTRIAGVSGLQTPISALNLANGVTLFQALDSFLTGVVTLAGTTNATTAVTGLSSTAQLAVGMTVSGAGIPAGATIAAITSATAITLSAAATTSGTPTLTFTGTSRDSILNLFRAG